MDSSNYNVYSDTRFICEIVPLALYPRNFNVSHINHTNCYLTVPLNESYFCQLYDKCPRLENNVAYTLSTAMFGIVMLSVGAILINVWIACLCPQLYGARLDYEQV